MTACVHCGTMIKYAGAFVWVDAYQSDECVGTESLHEPPVPKESPASD